MKLFLSKEEKANAELIATKRSNFALQDQLLQKELNEVIAEFCKRNSADIKKAKTLNIEQGFVEFEDEEKPDKKNKKNKGK